MILPRRDYFLFYKSAEFKKRLRVVLRDYVVFVRPHAVKRAPPIYHERSASLAQDTLGLFDNLLFMLGAKEQVGDDNEVKVLLRQVTAALPLNIAVHHLYVWQALLQGKIFETREHVLMHVYRPHQPAAANQARRRAGKKARPSAKVGHAHAFVQFDRFQRPRRV